MAPLQYLVIGANRGLGFEFVRQILQKPDTRVVATYRDARKIDDLKKLSEQTGSGCLELVQMDMTDDSSCKAAAQEVRSRVGSLDILIVNAGVIAPEKPLLDESLDDMLAMFSSNILGPLRIIQHFAPVLSSLQSKLVLITSEKGSLAAGKKASFPAYSISKAALNMLGRKISYELEGSRAVVALVDPGWVQTDMGGSDAPLTPSKSVGGILNVVDQVGMHNSGEYWRWDGQPLAW